MILHLSNDRTWTGFTVIYAFFKPHGSSSQGNDNMKDGAADKRLIEALGLF